MEHPGTYNGEPTFKWQCLALDRADGQVKPYLMPNVVYEQVEALQMNPDYRFDEVPMPYDLTLNVKGVKTLRPNTRSSRPDRTDRSRSRN